MDILNLHNRNRLKKYNDSFIHFVFEDYKTTKLSNFEFANKYEIDIATLIRWCRKYKVKYKNQYLTLEEQMEILQKYKVTNLSSYQFAKKHHINRRTLEKICISNNVKFRKKIDEINFLKKEYLKTSLSDKEFCEKYNISRFKLRRIKRRCK